VAVVDHSRLGYAVVPLTPFIIDKLANDPDQPIGFSRLAQAAPPANVRVGPSDTLSLTIFEAAAGGLFIPNDAGSRPGNFVQIPVQEVDRDGNISVPYGGGAVHVVGRTLREIQAEIEDRLRPSAIRPQVIVTMNSRLSSVVNIQGEIYTPSQVPLPPGGLKILAVLARAGGTRFPNYESLITLQRRGRVEHALLSTIVKDPHQNIQLEPGDDVYVSREPRAFLAMGATPTPGSIGGLNNRRFPFEADNLTLAEAIAKAGGLDSTRSDPRSVFLLRLVPRKTLLRIGVDVTPYPHAVVPTVFTVDLKGAEGFFIANNFFMRHRDIIFISDHPTVDLTKFLAVIQTITSTARDMVGLASDIQALTGD
jgi:polysaccharide export outer membrane protein